MPFCGPVKCLFSTEGFLAFSVAPKCLITLILKKFLKNPNPNNRLLQLRWFFPVFCRPHSTAFWA